MKKELTKEAADLLEHMSRVYCKHNKFNPDSLNSNRDKYWTVFAKRFSKLAEALSARGYVLIRKSQRDEADSQSQSHQEAQHAKYGPGGTHTDMGQ